MTGKVHVLAFVVTLAFVHCPFGRNMSEYINDRLVF